MKTDKQKSQRILTQLEIAEILDNCFEVYTDKTPEGRAKNEKVEKELAEEWNRLTRVPKPS